MALARSRRDRGVDYWPGFVDALSTLLLGIIFLLSIFAVVQFYLSQEVSGKDTALQRLNAQIAQLTDLLALEKTGRSDLEEQIASFRSNLAATESERDRLRGLAEGAGNAAAAQGKANELASQLDLEKQSVARALAQVELLNQQIAALRRQLGALEAALETSEKRDREFADPHRRSRPTAQSRARPARAGIAALPFRLFRPAAHGARQSPGRAHRRRPLRVPVGSVLRRRTGRAEAGRPTEIDKIASALLDLEKQIPADIGWVMRVDGHTDIRPIANVQFPSNWELSAARAIAVVQYMISRGVSPQRLVAAGFGEFQPLDTEKTEDAFRRNRRIELKLTER